MTYLSLLKIHFGPVAVEAVGPLTIIVVAIIALSTCLDWVLVV